MSRADVIILSKSTKSDKKFMVKFSDGKVVHFGAAGMSDFTIHKDFDRMRRYTARHSRPNGGEKWGKAGIQTAGFWAKWLLWNKPSLRASIKDIEVRFGVKIRYSRS